MSTLILPNVTMTGPARQMPDLVARLAGLHATLTARLTLRESLLSLSGRLDIVLQQVDLRATAAPAPLAHSGKKGKATSAGPTGTREPRRYVEGESEQETEAMEVELEKGSDAGSVEDIELGADSGSDADADADMEGEDEEDEEDDEDEEGLDEDDREDSEEDSEGDEGPWLNGFIDDEAEEDDESESE
jgi:U3 small nucleolar RNA-associated protein 5